MSLLEKIKKSVDNYVDNLALKDQEYRLKMILREREEYKSWTDKELRLATLAFKDDLQKGAKPDSLIVPAFALVNEVARRILGQSPFEVQILGGLVIHSGKVAEMKAGEGKTLTETMPVYLNALLGRGVHIITTNDYLAERDAKWMGKLYNFLGLNVGHITSSMKNEDRRKGYLADITYVTNQEIGFDYLRDNLVFAKADRVLRPEHALHFGIVDEIDSILIDESRTPLIIAEAVREQRQYYDLFTRIAKELKEERDYTVDYKNKFISLSNEGLDRAEQLLGTPIFSKDNPMYVFYLDVCLKAKVIFERDRDYIITGEGVEIVDEFTGRVLPGRRFTDGVHQAIEAKERVKVKEADRTVAAITFQNFFPMYEKLSGMSGTVMDSRSEFNRVYDLDIVQIPTNKPITRIDHNDLFFKTQKGKFVSLIKKVKQINSRGQPVLIGARNVETAHQVSQMLFNSNIPHQLLTAKDHRAEAEKIAQAGQAGMVTVATNMAGRGTDILLGPGVLEIGGLYVMGTERHESRRIDGQLIGRSGRQGEAGESVFLISMEDEIMQLFGSEKIIDVMEELDIPEDEYISAPSLDKAFKKAQDFVESKNFDSRIYLYKYDSITNFQRHFIYNLRDSLLENETNFWQFVKNSIHEVIAEILKLGEPKLIAQEVTKIFSIVVEEEDFSQLKALDKRPAKQLTGFFNEWLNPFYVDSGRKIKAELTFAQAVEKSSTYLISLAEGLKTDKEVYAASQNLILQILDSNWSSQLEIMEILKEEASLLSYASEEPLIDFILESKKLFSDMQIQIKKQFLTAIFLRLSQRGQIK